MWGELQLDTRSQQHDECRDRLLEVLSVDTTPILVPVAESRSLSSVLVQGPPGSDVGATLRNAARSLPHDLWPVVVRWELDDEAKTELQRTDDREWKDFWRKARERQG